MIVIHKDQEFWYEGNLICVAKRDLYAYEAASPTDFRWISVDHPQLGEPIHPALILAFKRGKEMENR